LLGQGADARLLALGELAVEDVLAAEQDLTDLTLTDVQLQQLVLHREIAKALREALAIAELVLADRALHRAAGTRSRRDFLLGGHAPAFRALPRALFDPVDEVGQRRAEVVERRAERLAAGRTTRAPSEEPDRVGD